MNPFEDDTRFPFLLRSDELLNVNSKSSEPSAFQKFEALARGVIAVPKAEIDRREADWKKARTNKKKS